MHKILRLVKVEEGIYEVVARQVPSRRKTDVSVYPSVGSKTIASHAPKALPQVGAAMLTDSADSKSFGS